MARDYVVRGAVGDPGMETLPDGEDYLARKVYEVEELIDIGVLDAAGRPIMARQRMDQIGFIRRNG